MQKRTILLSQYWINEEFDSELRLLYNPISPYKVRNPHYKNRNIDFFCIGETPEGCITFQDMVKDEDGSLYDIDRYTMIRVGITSLRIYQY